VENFKLVLNEVLDRDRETLLTIRTVKAITLCVRQSAFCSKKEKLRVMRKYSDHFRRAAGIDIIAKALLSRVTM